MSKINPRVSVGLPVFNGEQFLRQALDSVLAQTYPGFELIISDNASTDRTQDICEAYATRDKRIRYYRQSKNVGGGRNYNFVFEVSNGEYFKWLAHDDFIAPEYLARCVEVLDRDPSVVLCYSMFVDIDHQGNALTKFSRNRAKSTSVSERFFSLMSLDYDCEEVFGVIRSSVLRKTHLIRNYTDSDRTLLCEMSLYGQFYEVPELLLYHRKHPRSSIERFPDWHARMAWFDPSLDGRIVLPVWTQCGDYFRVIARVRLGTIERTKCYVRMMQWVWYFRRRLAKDLVLAFFKLFHLPLVGKLKPNTQAVARAYVDGAEGIGV